MFRAYTLYQISNFYSLVLEFSLCSSMVLLLASHLCYLAVVTITSFSRFCLSDQILKFIVTKSSYIVDSVRNRKKIFYFYLFNWLPSNTVNRTKKFEDQAPVIYIVRCTIKAESSYSNAQLVSNSTEVSQAHLSAMLFSFIAAVILAIAALSGSTNAACVSESYTNGCSVPLNAPFQYKSDFTPACHKHDICYRCVSSIAAISVFSGIWQDLDVLAVF